MIVKENIGIVSKYESIRRIILILTTINKRRSSKPRIENLGAKFQKLEEAKLTSKHKKEDVTKETLTLQVR